jgi:hypothetical protein
MTERWRKKLEGIDGASPSDDVFERAKQGPMHRDDALPGPRMSARVVTIVAAFLVFALAISVFAIPALRMNNTPGEGASQGLMPLWPSQSSDQLQKLQQGADVGTADWALDPKALTQKFAQEVMGWSGAVVTADPAVSCYVMTGPTGPSPVACKDLPVGGASAPAGVPTDLFSTPPSPGLSGLFKTYAVLQCGECPNREWVQAYQPLEQGDGGIWGVLQVQGFESLSVLPGQVVHDGSTVSAGFWTSASLIPMLGYGSCGQSAASSALHAPAGSGSGGIQSDVHLTGGCDGEQPGYVWAATAPESLVAAGEAVDPFNGGHPTLVSLTAVPVTMVFGAAESTSTAAPTPTRLPTTSISPASTTWTKYTDPYAWTVDVPPGWETNVITVGGGGTQGAQFVGDNMSIQVSTQTAPSGSPPPALQLPAANDSQFPLSADGVLSPTEGGLGGHFVGNGLQFDVLVLSPSLPDPLSQADADVLDRVIGSIAFQRWNVGDVRHDWVAIPTPTEDVSWITVEGGLYMLFKTPGGYKLYGSISCGGKPPKKTSSTADGFAVLDCPDGTSWEMDAGGAGGGDGSGQASTNDPPPEWPVATAHDGTLIAWVLPGVFPPGTGGSSPAPG